MNRLVRRCAVLALLCIPISALCADIVFTAPPREDAASGDDTYGPIATYLSQAIGQPVVYQHSSDWLSYVDRMQQDAYDLVFDGPHFVSYRIAKFGHRPLVKLPGQLDFVVVARRDNQSVIELGDLAGRPVCGHAPPNLATLTLQAQYPNPSRQPRILETRGFPNAFADLVARKCDGAVLPTGIYNKLNDGDNKGLTRILFQSKPLPHQAFSASTRVPAEIQDKIRDALLAPQGEAATAGLRKRFAGGKALLPASVEEYSGHAYLLRYEWGFDL